jgi:hypothetical protein
MHVGLSNGLESEKEQGKKNPQKFAGQFAILLGVYI